MERGKPEAGEEFAVVELLSLLVALILLIRRLREAQQANEPSTEGAA